MGINKILKPSVMRFVLLALLIFFGVLMQLFNTCFGPGPDAVALACLDSVWSKTIYVVVNPFMLGVEIYNHDTGSVYAGILVYSFLILQLLYMYVLSSIIVFLFSKKGKV